MKFDLQKVLIVALTIVAMEGHTRFDEIPYWIAMINLAVLYFSYAMIAFVMIMGPARVPAIKWSNLNWRRQPFFMLIAMGLLFYVGWTPLFWLYVPIYLMSMIVRATGFLRV